MIVLHNYVHACYKCWPHTPAIVVVCSVADPERVQGVQTPIPLPFKNILWKWNNLVSVRPNYFNNLVSVRPNYFIFIGYLRKIRKISKANPHTSIHMKPLPRKPLDPPLLFSCDDLAAVVFLLPTSVRGPYLAVVVFLLPTSVRGPYLAAVVCLLPT